MKYGRFLSAPGGFEINEAELVRPWHYIYTNDHIMLRVSQRGPVLAQAQPPCGVVLFNTSRGNQETPWQLFVETGRGALTAFPSAANAGLRTGFSCTFLPDRAEYAIRYGDVEIKTTLGISERETGVWMCSRIVNHGSERLRFRWLPAWRVFFAPVVMAPWDMPEAYQDAYFFNDPVNAVHVRRRDPSGNDAGRGGCFMAVSFDAAEAETRYREFSGYGGMSMPAALGRPMSDAAAGLRFGEVPPERHNVGNECVGAMRSRQLELMPGETAEISVSLVCYRTSAEPVARESLEAARRLLTPEARESAMLDMRKIFRDCTGAIKYDLPDKELENFLNYFLPWHLYWVKKLDRGWMSGMRGTRDSAQDFSGVALFDLDGAEEMLMQILSCQKIDGSFLRQYSAAGPEGKHDARDYVDSGCWVLELLYDCVRRRGDDRILERRARFLETPETATVAEHAARAVDYYLSPANRGVHGLILIHEGDWNDSLNNAGLEGRGESVMVSCQVAWLMSVLPEVFPDRREEFAAARRELIASLRKYALNGSGFLSGVYTDGDFWLFSEKDPDGVMRVNSVVNSWGIIAGIFTPEELPTVFKHLNSLRGPCGYRLFYPPLGKMKIPYGGRLSTGDTAPGLFENGTVYNHGSQGFLLRAAAAAGECSMIEDILLCALPYDQRRHPVDTTLSEPYGIVNYYRETADAMGEGGQPFISGTVSTLYRAVFEGIMGIDVHRDGIKVSPALPDGWPYAACEFLHRGKKLRVRITRDADGKCSAVLEE